MEASSKRIYEILFKNLKIFDLEIRPNSADLEISGKSGDSHMENSELKTLNGAQLRWREETEEDEEREREREEKRTMEEEEEVFESQMLRWITPEETLEDLVSRVARTTIKLKTSLPFMEEEEDASNKGQSQSQSQGRRARQRIKLRAGHVLELSGSNDTCKTECLLQAAATCILPQACGGCSSKVLFIDMISGLDPLRLVQILDARIRKSAAAKKASGSSLLEESLRRFQLVRCYSSLDLVCALKAISKKARQTEGQENESENLRLILVDNITAFYWTEKSFNGVQSVKTFDFTRREQRTDSSVSYSFRSVRNINRIIHFLSTCLHTLLQQDLRLPKKGKLSSAFFLSCLGLPTGVRVYSFEFAKGSA